MESASAYRGSPFARRRRDVWWRRLVPLTSALRGYRRSDARADVVAGLTVAALALPSGMAYAELAGVPAVYGLYALLLPSVAYALLGSSRQVVVGPEAAAATLVAATVGPLAAGDASRYVALSAALALLVGAVFAVAALVRLGFIADYFSRAVLVGYLTGIGVTLIVTQLEKLTGVPTNGDTPVHELWSFVTHLGEVEAATAAVGGAALAALLLMRRFLPRVPAALVVVVVAVVVSNRADLAAHGIVTVGDIHSGLPSLAVPSVSASDVLDLLPAAIGLFFVVYGDAILTARAFAGRHGQHVRAGQELLALGAANAVAGLSQSFVVGVSGSRTAVDDQTGVRSQLSGLVAASFVVVVLLFLTGPMAGLPIAVLGAVIFVAALGLLDRAAWRALATVARREVVIAVAAAVGVVTIGVLPALIVAVTLALLDAVLRSARPHDAVLGYVPRLGRWADVSVHRSAQVTDGVVVYRLDGRLFFANASYVLGRIAEAVDGAPYEVHHVVLDAEAITGVDASGLDALDQLLDELGRHEVVLVIARASTTLTRVLAGGGIVARIGPDHLQPTVAAGVACCSWGP